MPTLQVNLNLTPNTPTNKKGEITENLAKQYLMKQGLIPVCQNYQCCHGEIDLILSHQTFIVFIEVRYRKSSGFGGALSSISSIKQQKIIRTAEHFLMTHPGLSLLQPRLDVIGLQTTPHNTVLLEWLQNAIEIT